MNSLTSELQKTRLLPSVMKVSVSGDLTVITVDIRGATSCIAKHKNTLYFEGGSFSVGQVEKAIELIVSADEKV